MREIENICERCGDRPGDQNSRYLNVDECGLGDWVCMFCEQELEQEFWDHASEMYADMSNVGGKKKEGRWTSANSLKIG